MPTASAYSITVNGSDVTSKFDPVLISMTIKDSDGGKSDSLEITLDDTDGQILLPPVDADIEARLWSLDTGEAVFFRGKTDEPRSHGSRGSGMTISITAHSADMKGEGKHKRHKHKDGGTFKDAASQFGQDAGFTVQCDDDVGAVERDWWGQSNESFYSWGQRMADEIGATFKVRGTQAVFVSRNSSGSLGFVEASRPGNVISWDMTPIVARSSYETSKVRWYDPVEAKWNEESEDIDQSNSD